ncbi:hypothetical protein I79_004420 [Cricetulus griseus]|uniref:Uncharacterized protein n=1 Tax=Cricetulus griseus TaxID=10029 RepID=G3H2K5_CRIGR|nr:hypothetical protein I79_004420 [Cricetulus griseus]
MLQPKPDLGSWQPPRCPRKEKRQCPVSSSLPCCLEAPLPLQPGSLSPGSSSASSAVSRLVAQLRLPGSGLNKGPDPPNSSRCASQSARACRNRARAGPSCRAPVSGGGRELAVGSARAPLPSALGAIRPGANCQCPFSPVTPCSLRRPAIGG